MPEFVHCHCHTQYSLLDGAADIGTMMDKAKADGQKGVALTDHGNMFGAFKFVAEAKKRGLKPMVGCEFYLVEDRHIKAFSKAKGEKDRRYHQLMLAKNQKGYENLTKLCSLGFIEGLYSKFPRIDKELVLKYHEGLIVTSCCIGAEVPQLILQGKHEEAEKALKWWLDIFGEDYYIELQRHRGLENIDGLGISQEDVNQHLLMLAKKHNVKVIATNDSHYVEEEDSFPHDILLCVNTGNKLHEEQRFKFPSSDFYFKTQNEMATLFKDVPFAIDNTMEIYDKIDTLKLTRDILLPAFPLPKGFATQDLYLRHLTYMGAKKRYGTITATISERIDFELQTIANSGYPGYFLIVQDFTTAARKMGVAVGPGRGSAAGAVVSYCLGITNIDPIKYDLLFERFLNPERVSMPDIDIDFDDEGRARIMDYVIRKYGRNQVAQIITYGTMAAKSSVRDVGRVMDISIPEVTNTLAQFPNHMKATLGRVLKKGGLDAKLDDMNAEEKAKAEIFRGMAEQENEIGEMLRTAVKLEGSIRNTGIHACGVIITPGDITNYVPVKTDKESDILVTQFDNSVAEDAGLLKMDFLGLRTLTIIKDAVTLIKETHGIEIEPDEIPLDDENTYLLFQRGDTVGVFQYESAGMQKYMKELMPTEFSDLIAMNALYRPGPLAYIPNFINRKHGREPIVYDLAPMEEYLSETYGITVYQEQVMLLSQKLGNFTKGQADKLRKGMGKKQKDVIDALYPKFLAGCEANGHPKKIVDKVWKDWEAFASYAFNKSHSTCYAFVAFQTAYLKANYTAEFMAAVLTHNSSDITKVEFFLEECKRIGVEVLGPDVNESQLKFTVNKKGQIRFGLMALKGVGEGPIEAIIDGRAGKTYESVFDFIQRVNLRSVNKKAVESLALGGGFDCFEDMHRAQFFAPSDKYDTFLSHLLKYGNAYQSQESSAATSLFGGMTGEISIPPPTPPKCEKWGLIERLNREKEVVGIYLSGHPLDDFRLEIQNFTTCSLDRLDNFKNQTVNIGGIVIEASHRVTKKGTGWGVLKIQDFKDALEISLFGEDYINFKNYMNVGEAIYISGAYKPRWKGNDYEFKVSKIQLLETVGKSKTESVTVTIDITQITDSLITELEMLCLEAKGEHKFRIVFIDQFNKIKMDMTSRNQKVNADSIFVSKLEKMGLKYKLN
jgi:DNA polymerase III subunit alpha